MKELKCPNCGSVFTVDEADYASIVNQVKNAEFDAEVSRRIAELHAQHQAEQAAAEAKAATAYQMELSRKEQAMVRKEAEMQTMKNQLSSEINRLKGELSVIRQQGEDARKIAVIAEVWQQLPFSKREVRQGHRGNRQVHRAPPENQGCAPGLRQEPSSRQRQGRSADHQEADAQQSDHEGEVRGSPSAGI